ncbi:MAG TPA: hypothetical protein DCS88_13250 [Alphaproteobacteria bacterium]|nr:hypothetical protein [Alphaproteobacteria bacterium]
MGHKLRSEFFFAGASGAVSNGLPAKDWHGADCAWGWDVLFFGRGWYARRSEKAGHRKKHHPVAV